MCIHTITTTTIKKANGKEIVFVSESGPLDCADKGMIIFFVLTVMFSTVAGVMPS